jgi:hypothetical protein
MKIEWGISATYLNVKSVSVKPLDIKVMKTVVPSMRYKVNMPILIKGRYK